MRATPKSVAIVALSTLLGAAQIRLPMRAAPKVWQALQRPTNRKHCERRGYLTSENVFLFARKRALCCEKACIGGAIESELGAHRQRKSQYHR